MNESLVPAADVDVTDDGVRVPFTKDQVKDAPNVDVDSGHLDQSEERRLYDHYGMTYSERSSDSGLPEGGTTDTRDARGTVGHDTSGPTTDDAMTRSEERLDVGTTSEEAGRARLRKYVTTEQETVTVPVKKERAVIETEPISGDDRDQALSGPAISEEEHEVVLNEERAVVGKTTEPVERVRLDKETVTEEETVNEEVRKEHIEAEGDVQDRRGTV
ncbi:YsnF/AvaK domain-containing protein [Nocardioides ganghwensis]|uniref:YsnF/AvaK domain-containing protein n=1 Tax=Nocardioides ganghwensis TaxID=252230 RepID=UPI001A91B8E8|nr:YsnF/AvaK domain-containing protein [Nocardioides ganghwensis]